MKVLRDTGVALLLAFGGTGHAQAEPNCNVGIEFHPGGGVRACVLNGDHRLYTPHGSVVICADGKRLEQYPDGALAGCTLREPVHLDGRDCPRGAELRLAPGGALERCGRTGSG